MDLFFVFVFFKYFHNFRAVGFTVVPDVGHKFPVQAFDAAGGYDGVWFCDAAADEAGEADEAGGVHEDYGIRAGYAEIER